MTLRTPGALPLEHVSVVEEEVVVAGGVGTVSWLVSHHDGWVRAPSHPSAHVDSLERGSGVVWRRRVTLELELGSELVRIEARPAARPRTALDYLTSGTRGSARQTSRLVYRVSVGGELARAKPGTK